MGGQGLGQVQGCLHPGPSAFQDHQEDGARGLEEKVALGLQHREEGSRLPSEVNSPTATRLALA